MLKKFIRCISLITVFGMMGGCHSADNAVVIYVSLDRTLAEPILAQFQQTSNIEVKAVYDTEANKTSGMVNRLLAEAARPRADLFWNNETAQMSRLAESNILEKWTAARSPDRIHGITDTSYWSGFAARMRVILVNTNLNPDQTPINSLADLTNPMWNGKAAIANPHFGTTGTHFAALLNTWGEARFRQWLQAVRANHVVVLPGNAQVKNAVADGQVVFGFTDTDDANEALQEGKPVRMIIPDQTESGLGALLIPNAIAILKAAPHPNNAKKLAEFLLSASVEQQLAASEGNQIPIRNEVSGPRALPALATIKLMPIDYVAAGKVYSHMLNIVDQEWPQ